MLLKVFSFYSRSPKRYRELRAIADLKHVRVISLKRAEGTRWISHRLNAMEAFLQNYSCLITHWEDITHPARADVKDTDKAIIKGFLKRITSSSFLAFFMLYMDILADISAISKVFQQSDLSTQEVVETVKVHLASLQQLKEGSPAVRQFFDEVETTDGDGDIADLAVYRGVPLKGTLAQAKQQVNEHGRTIMTAILEKMEDRFHDFSEDPILGSAEVFDPSIWPDEPDKLVKYGEEEILRLLSHFKIPLEVEGVDLSAAKREWLQLKSHISKYHKGTPYKTMWKAIFNKKASTFGNIMHLVAIVMVLPVSNAILERAFSAMARVLTDWRRSLKTEILSDLMLITMEGPAKYDDFNAKASVDKWLLDVGGKIRPNRREKRNEVVDDEQLLAEVEFEEVEIVEMESDDDGNVDDDDDDDGNEDDELGELDVIELGAADAGVVDVLEVE